MISVSQKKPKYIDSSHNRSNRYLQDKGEMNNIITKTKDSLKSTHKKLIPLMSIYTLKTNYRNLYLLLLLDQNNNNNNISNHIVSLSSNQRERERVV